MDDQRIRALAKHGGRVIEAAFDEFRELAESHGGAPDRLSFYAGAQVAFSAALVILDTDTDDEDVISESLCNVGAELETFFKTESGNGGEQ